MTDDPKRVIVTDTCCEACSVQTVRVHHTDFPELRVEGETAEAAAANLAHRLEAAHDGVSDPSHREAIRAAIADTKAFLGREGTHHVGRDVSKPRTS